MSKLFRGSTRKNRPTGRTAFDQAVVYLAKRDHSEKELRDKLKLLEYSSEDIGEAIEEAKLRKYIVDPTDLAERVARQLHGKKKSHIYIIQYLREKGLPPVERVIELEIEKGQRIIEQKLGHLAPFSPEEIEKVRRWLLTRGFDSETVRKVIYEKPRD